MAVNPTGWAVQGARHSAAVARGVLYDSLGGNGGISAPDSMHVKETGTPSNQVQVAPGRAGILNTYTGGSGQIYGFQNDSTTLVDIPASDSTGTMSWYVCATVHDPNYSGGGNWPADPKVGPYMFLEVFSTSETIPYSHIKLAQVTVPASTATITNDMIFDVREVANPKSDKVTTPRPLVTADYGSDLTLTSRAAYPQGEWFPNVGGPDDNGRWDYEVPEWATRAQIRCEWLDVALKNNPGYGFRWVAFGPGAGSTPQWYTQGMGWNSLDGSYTTNWVVHQEISIRAEWRGATMSFVPRANITSPTSYTGTVEMNAQSNMVFSVEWFGRAANGAEWRYRE